MPSTFETYLKKIEIDLCRSNGTDYTYRGSLKKHIESFAN